MTCFGLVPGFPLIRHLLLCYTFGIEFMDPISLRLFPFILWDNLFFILHCQFSASRSDSEHARQWHFIRAEVLSNLCLVTLRTSFDAEYADSLIGTTTAKGPYANFFFELHHYAFGGVGVTGFGFARALHFDFGVDRRVPPPRGFPPRSPFLGCPFFVL